MKIPDTEHWATIIVHQTYIEGDERSRTNPGHGYPGHYQETTEYQAFTNFEDFEAEVSRLTLNRRAFKAVKVKPLKVETKISVELS